MADWNALKKAMNRPKDWQQMQVTDPDAMAENLRRAVHGEETLDNTQLAPQPLQGAGINTHRYLGTPEGDHMTPEVQAMQAANAAQAGNPEMAAKLEAMKRLRQAYIDKQNAQLKQAVESRAPAAVKPGQSYPAEE